MNRRRLSRRAILAAAGSLAGAGGLSLVLNRDGGIEPSLEPQSRIDAEMLATQTPTAAPTATATATPEPPFVMLAGEATRPLMAGTPYETPLHLFGSGKAGPVLMVLGGVHGNEPGGWQAAERIAAELRPAIGGLLVVPYANIQAVNLFVRTTEDLGDLNRLYPGDPDGLPMARMAHLLIAEMRAHQVSLVLDLHESWGFYRDRPQSGTAFLGQTVTAAPGGPGTSIAMAIVESINGTIQAPHEELFFRDRSFASRAGFPGGTRRSSSSLGIPNYVTGAGAVLVEMGQQQPLERRVAIHVDVVREGMRLLGLTAA